LNDDDDDDYDGDDDDDDYDYDYDDGIVNIYQRLQTSKCIPLYSCSVEKVYHWSPPLQGCLLPPVAPAAAVGLTSPLPLLILLQRRSWTEAGRFLS